MSIFSMLARLFRRSRPVVRTTLHMGNERVAIGPRGIAILYHLRRRRAA